MGNDLIDRRLHAARPAEAEPDLDLFDPDLLARVREEPIARATTTRHVPRAVAVTAVAGVTLTAAAVYQLAAQPGDVGGPGSASAITAKALRWLTPPADTVLHTEAVETRQGTRTTHEFWQSADHPEHARELERGDGGTFERQGPAFYDAASNTIYAPEDERGGVPDGLPTGDKGTSVPVSDPIVYKVRSLLQEGRMSVGDHTVTVDGVEAWPITLNPGEDREPWTMWVAAADGKPVKLSDPSDRDQVIRWTTYEVLPDSQAADLATLTGAHPDARVVTDPEQIDAAVRRLFPKAIEKAHEGQGPKKGPDKQDTKRGAKTR